MTSRERILGIALLVVAALAGTFYGFSRFEHDEPSSDARPHVLTESFAHELAQIRQVEKIEDAEQRCLAFPDPAEFSWDRKVIKAFCRLSARKMLSWSEINDALAQNHPEILQQAFDSYLERTYKRGQHGFLTWTFRSTFENASDEVRNATTKWVEADPQSAYAVAARGMHYVAAAYEARGTAFARDTPEANLVRMRELAAKAKTDLEEALRRNPRLISAYHGFLRLARLTGDDELRKSSVKEALALDPADQWLYDDWMDAVEPKWGGSIREMQRAADTAALHVRSNALLKRAAARPLCYAAQQSTDNVEALDLYRKAAAFGPAACFLKGAGAAAERSGDLEAAVRYFSQGIRLLGDDNLRVERADVLHKLGQTDWALADMGKVLATNPRNTYALDHQAFFLEMSGRPLEAENSYLAMLAFDPNNERAALQLSRLYLYKLAQTEKAAPLIADLLERNPRLARAWLYKAALANGKDEAVCREALENYLKYVNRDSAYEKTDIARAQVRLDELKRKT